MTAPLYRELALAKLTRRLKITGRRADGYHLLAGEAVFLHLSDVLDWRPALNFSVTVTGGVLPPVNSVTQAAERLAAQFGLKPHGQLTLHKNIPIAAGLGGGSADAAAAMRLLCRTWNIAPNAKQLMDVALSIGADVPMCLASRPCRFAGIGEIMEPLPDAGGWVCLIKPPTPLLTAAVYQRFRDLYPHEIPALPGDNDLATAAMALCPSLAAMVDFMQNNGTLVGGLAGSGACCFAILPNNAAATALALAGRRRFPDAWITVTPIFNAAAVLPIAS